MNDKKNVVKSFNTLIGKLSGKEELESEIERLNSRIVELELDLKTLSSQLEKNEMLASQAVADREEAEARLNAELIRGQALSKELEILRDKKEASEKLEFRGMETLSPAAMSAYFSRLASIRAPTETLLTAFLPPHTLLSEIMDEKTLACIDKKARSLLDRLDSETGAGLFYDIHRMVSEAVIPPFPVTESGWYFKENFETGHLEESLKLETRMLVLLLHAGDSFVGFAPDSLAFETEEVIRSSVKEKHTKGGFSQRRFERLREEDIAHHLEKVMEAVQRVLEAKPGIDCVLACGDPLLLRQIEKRFPFDIKVIEKSLDIKVEKNNSEEILKAVLSWRRYLL